MPDIVNFLEEELRELVLKKLTGGVGTLLKANSVDVFPLSPFVDLELANNTSSITTYFAPCIDLFSLPLVLIK